MNVKELVEKLTLYNYHYTNGEPLVSDKEYDDLYDKLYELDPKNAFFKKIGCKANNNCVKLPYHLGSQTKIKTSKALDNWMKKYNTNNYVISEKLDGISAYYNSLEGKLYTRGNGTIGSDISHILPYINLPLLEKTNNVRGELIISKANWNPKYGSNARNVVAGLVNAKILNKKLLKLVDLVIYQVLDVNMCLSDSLQLVKKNCVIYNIVNNINIEYLTKQLITFKTNSNYEIDGIVVTDNSQYYYNIDKGNPDFSFAFKSIEIEESATTTVIDVEYKLSKDNRYKPRVVFNKISIDNVNIECATGYNAKFIMDNGIGIDAVVKVVRSGQVIPKIVEVIKKTEAKMPNSEWQWDDTHTDAIFVKTDDKESPKEQRVGRTVYFFKTLGIKNLSEGTVNKLYENGFTSLESILKIKDVDSLKGIEGFGDKKINIILDCIKQALSVINLEEIMGASNIFERSLGVKKLKLIIDNFDNIMTDNITLDKLVTIKGIGNVNAQQFLNNFGNFKQFYEKYYIENKKDVKDEKDNDNKKDVETLDKKLIGKKVSFTGFRDKALEKQIELNGGKVVSTISKTTDILITKDINSNSSSMKKAKELGIVIIPLSDIIQ